MAYIGREPQIGNFQVCDAISVVNGQAAYTMQVGGVNASPETANHMLVSLNGILQAPTTSFTVSGATITFASNLVTGDVINFIQILGSVLDLGVPSDATVSLAKLTATGTKSSSTFLRGDNTFAAPSGGKVLQVVNATFSTSTTTNSSTYSDSGLTANITPSATSSKVLIFISLNGVESRDNRTWLNAKLLRDSTDIVAEFGGRAGYGQKYGYTDSDYHRGVGGVSCTFLDTPSSSSELTYKIQIASDVNVSSIGICSDGGSSQITLMEVAG